MTIRLACASTFTALGLACSSTAFARMVVYMPVPVIYAPPRTVYRQMPVNPVLVTAPPPTNYAALPASTVIYAQPLIAVPRQPDIGALLAGSSVATVASA